MAEREPVGHTVHIERLHERGVAVYLDGVRVKSLKGWSLVEEHRPPSVLTLVINTDEIHWGAPPPPAPATPFRDDGREHFMNVIGGRVTPSGKRACETCGESWMCSTALHRWERSGGTSWAPPARAVRCGEMDAHAPHAWEHADGAGTIGGECDGQPPHSSEVDKDSDAPLGSERGENQG